METRPESPAKRVLGFRLPWLTSLWGLRSHGLLPRSYAANFGFGIVQRVCPPQLARSVLSHRNCRRRPRQRCRVERIPKAVLLSRPMARTVLECDQGFQHFLVGMRGADCTDNPFADACDDGFFSGATDVFVCSGVFIREVAVRGTAGSLRLANGLAWAGIVPCRNRTNVCP
jgi:hypothetical protein